MRIININLDENKILNLKKIKEDIVNKTLDELTSSATSDIEKELLKEDLRAKINSNILITEQNINSAYEINAEDLNKTFNELYIDLLTTFAVNNSISSGIDNYNISYKSNIETLKTKINLIKSKLTTCRRSISSLHMPEFYIENFKTGDKLDKTRELQKDRYGQWIPSKCYVRYAEQEESVTLPIIRQDNSLRYSNRVATAEITKHFQLGEGFIESSIVESDVSKIIDANETSFWSDDILSDSIITMSFDPVKPPELFVGDNYFYDLENGAICELEINFESVNTINEVTLSPYCKYPINIVAIRYKLTDDEDEALTEIAFPGNVEAPLRDITTDSKTSYKFSDILCKKIFILFSQDHYERQSYVYKTSDVNKNQMWFDSKNSKSKKITEALFKPNYADRTLTSAMWNNVNDRLIKTNSDDLADIILPSSDKVRKLIKYNYQYGFYNIGCFNNHFDRTGIYVSKTIKLNSSIKTVSIKTEEVHQLDTLKNTVTDIEYYISVNESPSAEDWIPVMPEGKYEIQSELLFITAETRAFLRFECEVSSRNEIRLLKNGEALPTDSNEYELDINERTGKIWCIQIFNYDYDAVYSLKYIPEAGHTVIDFGNRITTSIETFEGKNRSQFKLVSFPFLDSTLDYCNVKLTDISNTGMGTEIVIENVTDLTNPSSSYRYFDKKSNNYQFYVSNNNVFFNKDVKENFLIEISYRHLISNVKLKALLRRNSTKDGWLTPILKEINYNIETY